MLLCMKYKVIKYILYFMSEFITVQVGQCGNQIGSSFWPSVLEEYGFQNVTEGYSKINNTKDYTITELQSSFHSFFTIPSTKTCTSLSTISDLKQSKVKARTILVDMEDSVLSRYKSGPLRDLFDDQCFVSNYPGSGNNWAEGYCYHGPQYQNKILNTVRRAVEKCDSLQGFLLMFSVGGGTGSGLGTYILQLLDDSYPNIERLASCVYPIGTEDVITCPYNMALSTRELIEHASCVFPVENRALLDIVSRQYNNKSYNTEYPKPIVEYKPFHDMNNLVVNMLLHLTSGSRFPGNINVDINEISTNMVPYPKMHFLSSSFSPIVASTSKSLKHTNSQPVKDEIFRTTCSRNHQLLKVDPLGAKSVVLGTTLIGRGDFSISDMRSYVERLQTKGHYTPWSRKAVKIGLCNVPPAGHSAAMLSLFNTTAMSTLFSHVAELYKKLYKKKAHVHHYTQVPGFDLQYFDECQNSILASIASYKQMENSRSTKISRPLTS